MNRKVTFTLLTILAAAAVLFVILFAQGHTVAVLQPRGAIALQERTLMFTALLLMLIVVIPVFILTGFITWKYRAGNTKATYTPDWDHNLTLESIWWGLPCLIIAILAIITWKSSHDLDPFKPLNSNTKPLTIQVIALPWKWLFIYPEQQIATVNYVQFPQDTPINFTITSDAPMNSFWIPQLGGQVYAMSGMSTKLHLIADEAGSYAGSSANLSGAGFAGMRFTATATSSEEFKEWAETVKRTSSALDATGYNQLATPSEHTPAASYVTINPGLYDTVIMKYMAPDHAFHTQ